ncbi:uncharacterized protein MYCGRDRAFT_80321, partial [Zymoseptoria tritici IPO323]
MYKFAFAALVGAVTAAQAPAYGETPPTYQAPSAPSYGSSANATSTHESATAPAYHPAPSEYHQTVPIYSGETSTKKSPPKYETTTKPYYVLPPPVYQTLPANGTATKTHPASYTTSAPAS